MYKNYKIKYNQIIGKQILLHFSVVLAGLSVIVLASCSKIDPKANNTAALEKTGNVVFRVSNPSSENIIECKIILSDNQEVVLKTENLEPGQEIFLEANDIQIPPDIKIKWKIKQSSGPDWIGYTNRYIFTSDQSVSWDESKTQFAVIFSDPPVETSGFQE